LLFLRALTVNVAARVAEGTLKNDVATLEQFAPLTFRFYRHAVRIMNAAGVPFLVGGAYAFAHYTGITRHTKDFDVFLRPADVERALAAFAAAGYRSEMLFAHWLAKGYHNDDFVDLIFSSGNGLCAVDEAWFAYAPAGELMGEEVRLVPAEEMIWQKSFIMERERFDGADVNHLLRARGAGLDWDRLLMRFGPNWRVLFAHLVLFGFVYPHDHKNIPAWVLSALADRLKSRDGEPPATPVCRGTLLSRMQYLTDIEEWDYGDPRLPPNGKMTPAQIIAWTDAGR
jgi:hypothetical protein